MHAHLSEQPAENEAALAAYGKTPTRVLYDAGVLGPRSTMVHATPLTPAAVDLLAGGATVAGSTDGYGSSYGSTASAGGGTGAASSGGSGTTSAASGSTAASTSASTPSSSVLCTTPGLMSGELTGSGLSCQ